MPAPGAVFSTLDFPGSSYTRAYGISGNTIVGQYLLSSGNFTGFEYNAVTHAWMSLDDPSAPSEGNGTYPSSISGSTVVGSYGVTGYQGFIYDGSSWTTVYPPSGSSQFVAGYPTSISGNQIVGFVQYATGPQQGYTGNTGGPYSLLPNLSGFNVSPTGISGNVIVGFYRDSSQVIHGFRYDGGGFTALDDPGAVGRTYPEGVSGSSIVGVLSASTSGEFVQGSGGFLFDGASWATINDPLGTGGTWPRGIDGENVVGWYVDSSGRTHGFLAAVPEPNSVVLILLAMPLIGASWRRHRRSRASPRR